MPRAVRFGDLSIGHGCFPPTPVVSTPVSKTRINGKLAVTVGAMHATHSCPPSVHPQSTRVITSGASKTRIEGSPVARVGDPIACGDTTGGQFSSNTNVE